MWVGWWGGVCVGGEGGRWGLGGWAGGWVTGGRGVAGGRPCEREVGGGGKGGGGMVGGWWWVLMGGDGMGWVGDCVWVEVGVGVYSGNAFVIAVLLQILQQCLRIPNLVSSSFPTWFGMRGAIFPF